MVVSYHETDMKPPRRRDAAPRRALSLPALALPPARARAPPPNTQSRRHRSYPVSTRCCRKDLPPASVTA
eukprot:6207451-Pleurochrysis_carterae.AAC.3